MSGPEQSQELDLTLTQTKSKTSATASRYKSKKKKPSTDEEKKDPMRTFKALWTIGRTRLKFDGKSCSTCTNQEIKTQKESKKQSRFITGCTNLRLETVKDREISATHKFAPTAQEIKQKPFSKKPRVSVWMSLNTSPHTKVKRLKEEHTCIDDTWTSHK